MDFQAGWYPDPSGNPYILRWWNGVQWTEHTAMNTPPPPAQGAPGSFAPNDPSALQSQATYQEQSFAGYTQPAVQQQQPVQTSPTGRSACGITGLVLGIIAAATCFIPIINNFSALIALVGLVFAIVGTVACFRRRKSGKALSLAGLILCVVAFILVLVTQMIYSAALEEMANELSPSITSYPTSNGSPSNDTSTPGGSSGPSTNSDPSSSSQPSATTDLSLGTPVTYSNGLMVSVDSVESGLTMSYSDKEVTCITVTYVNNGQEKVSFNAYEWAGEDAQGAQRSQTFYTEGTNELHSGELSPGGTVTGNVYFESPISKVVFQESFWSDVEATWIVS